MSDKKTVEHRPLRVATLFSGVGAFEQALKQLGINTALSSHVTTVNDILSRPMKRSSKRPEAIRKLRWLIT